MVAKTDRIFFAVFSLIKEKIDIMNKSSEGSAAFVQIILSKKKGKIDYEELSFLFKLIYSIAKRPR